MFENKNAPLPHIKIFALRVMLSLLIALFLIMIALGCGMLGYHHFEGMVWIDAFVNAAMILSGMGPVGSLQKFEGKLFAGLYALFSGLVFILIMGIIITPIAHRFFHQFHLKESSRDKDKT
ncbi:MAG: hypothetical protein ACH350_03355 [Parachlamydiaceae bacterium]